MAVLTGTNATDILNGTIADDSISGLGGDDVIFADLGRDTIRAGNGDDYVEGGAGERQYSRRGRLGLACRRQGLRHHQRRHYRSIGVSRTATPFLITSRAEPRASTSISPPASPSNTFGNTDHLIDIERVVGSEFADTLTGGNIANDFAERFRGYEGNDTIDGGYGLGYRRLCLRLFQRRPDGNRRRSFPGHRA